MAWRPALLATLFVPWVAGNVALTGIAVGGDSRSAFDVAPRSGLSAAIVRDWEQQDAAGGLSPGSLQSIESAIDRGRSAARRLSRLGRVAEANKGLAALADVERASRDLFAQAEAAAVADALTATGGWHLVQAAVCGGGPALDSGRVRGTDYRYGTAPRRVDGGLPVALQTVSWDAHRVIYRFDGIPTNAPCRLRTVFGVDAARTMSLAVNGRVLGEVTVPDGGAVERVDIIPPDAFASGVVELVVAHVAGANAIVSGIELWSPAAKAPPADVRSALLARRRLTSWERPAASAAAHSLYIRARQVARDLLFARPELDFDELLFVRRHWPSGNHQCAHRVGEHQTPGADLCILTGLRPDGKVRRLLPRELAEKGGVGRPDLSFDATRIVFPYARPSETPTPYRWSAGHAAYDPAHPADSSAYRGGACRMYDIYEIGVDGTGLRRLTDDDTAEDTEPCYLPDGRIAFTSSRGGRLVQCGDWALVFGLWRMNADGSGAEPITQPQDTEFYPALLADGRLLYTRWDYVMKPYNALQQLWSVNPDGTRAQLAYGDWFAFSRGPIALQEARSIPGTSKVVAIGAAHHNTGAGPLMVADLALNRAGPAGLVNLTPEIGYPECGALLDERVVRAEPDIAPISNTRNPAGWYASPWPLSEELFFVCYSFDSYNASSAGYGIYLLDTHGGKELVFRFPDASCYAPIPLRPRRAPPIIPDTTPPDDPRRSARLYLQNVYTGLDGVPPGTVKWLRVCETYPKLRHTNPHRVDAGVGCGWDMRGVLGTVPVLADGSAYFEVPAGRMLFFEALDANHLELRRMRNYVDLKPGESQGCAGCHERPGVATTAAAPRSLALEGPPATLEPPPWGAGPMRFPRVVQPVLDRQCVRCHDGAGGADHAFDLRGLRIVRAPHAGDRDEGPQHHVSDSFLALLPHVSYVKVTGHGGRKLPLDPYETGSAVSRLMRLLLEGHYDVRLPSADWRALAAWIDCNAPYYGSYDDTIELVGREP